MPTNAVYQPTTVTYEQQPNDQRWNCPISYFSRRVTSSLNRAVCLRIGLCLLGSTLCVIGLALLIAGGVQYSNTPAPTTPDSGDNGLGTLIAGGVLLFVGLIFAIVGVWAWSSRLGGGKEAPASGAAALTALNPSTDPLVAAQYAPVRDAPPAPDDEMRNLMDNKECLSSAEESDKMLDGRPSVA
ncbi:uncharacterized protein LOC115446313 [Manduca sexta]|uniref:Uncharacterized protein n=1 Tax=Manduca sexta TaxID=7130 RepID=A0A921ZAL5_MANSE|nr:uncharacterized protein LOC115446313 [Manduca sexta]KAG6454483.1 hypothetical protein O3G_MSEX008744 [Manduca sexta]